MGFSLLALKKKENPNQELDRWLFVGGGGAGEQNPTSGNHTDPISCAAASFSQPATHQNTPAPATVLNIPLQSSIIMTDKIKGTVKWFSNRKGFGFITPTSENSPTTEDIFVHQSNIVTEAEYRTLVRQKWNTESLSCDNRCPVYFYTGFYVRLLVCR